MEFADIHKLKDTLRRIEVQRAEARGKYDKLNFKYMTLRASLETLAEEEKARLF